VARPTTHETLEGTGQAPLIDPLRIDLETGLAATFASRPAEDPDGAAVAEGAAGGAAPTAMANDLVSRILKLRGAFTKETGFVIPDVRIRDSALLERDEYAIFVRNNLAARGRLRPDGVLVVDIDPTSFPFEGEVCRDPAFGLPAAWVDKRLREAVLARGYTVVTPVQALITHFMEVVREHVGVLLGYGELQKILATLDKDYRTLLAEVCPGRIPQVTLQRILQNLLVEHVSIRDLGLIVEAVVEGVERTRDPELLTELVRRRLAWQICTSLKGPDGMIPALVTAERTEQMLGDGLRPDGEQLRSAHKPGDLADLLAGLEQGLRAHRGEPMPILVVSPTVRRFVRQLVARSAADPAVARLTVLSTEEIHPKARLKILGRV
jgi:flagellar biosynthesis protein FlhA